MLNQNQNFLLATVFAVSKTANPNKHKKNNLMSITISSESFCFYWKQTNKVGIQLAKI